MNIQWYNEKNYIQKEDDNMKRNSFEVLYSDLEQVTVYLDKTGKRYTVAANGSGKAVISVNLSKKETTMLQALSCMKPQTN